MFFMTIYRAHQVFATFLGGKKLIFSGEPLYFTC